MRSAEAWRARTWYRTATPTMAGNQGQNPPPDGLTVDRCLDGPELSILVGHTRRGLQGTHFCLEPRQFRSPALQANGVTDVVGGMAHHGVSEGRRDQNLVQWRRSCRKVDLRCLDSDNTHRDDRTGGLGARSFAVESRALGVAKEWEVDHGSDLDIILLLQRERWRVPHQISRDRASGRPPERTASHGGTAMNSTERLAGFIGWVQRQTGFPLKGPVMVADAATSGKPDYRGNGSLRIDGGIKPVSGDEGGERSVRSSPGGNRREHKASDHADQNGDDHP